MKKNIFRIGAVLVVALLLLGTAGYFGAGVYIFNQLTAVQAMCGCCADDLQNTPVAFTSGRLDTTPYLMAGYEDVSFPSRDEPNVTIAAWFVPAPGDAPQDAPAVILVHGLNSCKGSEHILIAAGMLNRNGYNVLLIDLRNMGQSSAPTGRFAAGTHEYKDVLGAWDYLVSTRGFAPEKVGLLGHSLGAASVLIAFGEEGRIAAAWEDSSFADMTTAVQAELARSGFPVFMADSGVLAAQVVGNIDLTTLSPLHAMDKLNGRPLFITHGAADTRLSVDYAYQLADAARAQGTDVTPWIVADADHVEAIFMLPEEYERRLVAFFSAALGMPAGA